MCIRDSLEASEEYCRLEAPYLAKIVGEDAVERLQKFAVKYSEKETDRATYQAMEALVHNLNTMHSRAGAQEMCIRDRVSPPRSSLPAW